MNIKVFIPQTSANSKPLDLKTELKELRSILDKIEKEISGKEVSDPFKKLIKNSFQKASGFLESTLTYKRFSDQNKRK